MISLTNRGYIKRLPLETYRPQRRGGRGVTGMGVREADAIRRLMVATRTTSCCSSRTAAASSSCGPTRCRTPRGRRAARRSINLIEIEPNELVTAVVATSTFDKDYMLLATIKGEIKKTPLKEFESVRRAGLIAMGLEDGDELVFARLARDDDDVIMVSTQGKAIRFSATELRSASRMSGGVRGMRIQPDDDQIVALEVVVDGAMLLTTSETGLGKRTDFSEYPTQGSRRPGRDHAQRHGSHRVASSPPAPSCRATSSSSCRSTASSCARRSIASPRSAAPPRACTS